VVLAPVLALLVLVLFFVALLLLAQARRRVRQPVGSRLAPLRRLWPSLQLPRLAFLPMPVITRWPRPPQLQPQRRKSTILQKNRWPAAKDF